VPPHEVDVVFTKYGGRAHRRQMMTWLGADEHGSWLGAPAGSTVLVGAGAGSFVTRQATVRLVPPTVWWTALFTVADTWDVYCDIATPARWTSRTEVAFVDLDLDLYRTSADRRVDLLDQPRVAASSRSPRPCPHRKPRGGLSTEDAARRGPGRTRPASRTSGSRSAAGRWAGSGRRRPRRRRSAGRPRAPGPGRRAGWTVPARTARRQDR
jgi:hypothetical protein